MRAAGRHRHQQRVAGAPASTSGALHIVGLRRRHRTQQRRRQVADVDAHLQGWRRGQNVDATRPAAVRLEVTLHTLARFAGKQARVLVGHHALNLGSEIQLAVEVAPAPIGMQVALATCAPARLIVEVLGQARQHLVLAVGAPPLAPAQLDVEGRWLQAPDVNLRLVQRLFVGRQARLSQGVKCQPVHVAHDLLRAQHDQVQLLQGLERPVLEDARFVAFDARAQLVLGQRQEPWRPGPREHLFLAGVLLVGLWPAADAREEGQHRVAPGADALHLTNQAAQEHADLVGRHLSQDFHLLAQAHQQPTDSDCHRVGRRRDAGRAGRDQGAPHMCVLSKFRVDNPRHHLRHLHRHLAAAWQLAGGHQRVHVPHPVQLRRQEVRHIVVVAQSGPPLRFKGLGQLRQRQWLSSHCGRCDGLGQRRTQVQAPGARGQEACPVRSVLHRV